MQSPVRKIAKGHSLFCLAENCTRDAEYKVWPLRRDNDYSDDMWVGAAACSDHVWEVMEHESEFFEDEA